MSTNAIKKQIVKNKHLKLRDHLWPNLKEGEIWNRLKSVGFTTIPRTLSIFMTIMDKMAPKGKPVSAVYFELWCRAYDEHFVVLVNKQEMAFHSGFTGERGVQTWTSRIDVLDKLGFIKTAPGPQGRLSYALIINPYWVIKSHSKNKTPGLTNDLLNALMGRASEIGAEDDI